MRWRRRRQAPEDPSHGLDGRGRLYGDGVRPSGWPGWQELLEPAPVRALAEPTQPLPTTPLMTPGQRWRGDGADGCRVVAVHDLPRMRLHQILRGLAQVEPAAILRRWCEPRESFRQLADGSGWSFQRVRSMLLEAGTPLRARVGLELADHLGRGDEQ